MRIRTLVPALACLAAAPLATAAEGGSTVKIDGFVDSVLSGYSVIDSSPADVSDSNTAFSYQAKLGVAATITEKVRAQVDLFVTGDDQSPDVQQVYVNGTPVFGPGNVVSADVEGVGGNQIYVRQAYGAWQITPEVELKTGKFISNYGWVAAYAPDLYRVNSGPILDLYGVDQIGADVKWQKDALTVAFTVANGFFGEDTNGSAQSGSDQKDQSFAYGVDVIFDLGNDKGEVNAELVYDMEANPNPLGGGDGMHLGLNATITPSEQLTIGGEFIYQMLDANEAQTGPGDDDQTIMALMAMANFKLGSALPVPASVTGMIQYLSGDGIDYVKDDSGTMMELSVALLTQPAGTKNLGANFEVFYLSEEFESSGSPTVEASTIGLAAELLYVF